MQIGVAPLIKCFPSTWNKIILVLFMLLFLIIVSMYAMDGMNEANVNSSMAMSGGLTEQETPSSIGELSTPVQDLIVALKNATAVTLAKHNQLKDVAHLEVEISSKEQSLWENENPCASRAELASRYESRPPPAAKNSGDPGLPELLEAYAGLHRVCIRASGNLTRAFLSENGHCRFLVAEAGNGVGNRVMWMVSNLMYALLTGRVLLVDPRSRIPALMCQPFLGSSWAAPPDFPFADLRPELWASTTQFLAAMDARRERNQTERPMAVHAARADDTWGPAQRFFCSAEQAAYAHVRWLTLGGCLYFLPKLFAVPALRPVLDALFRRTGEAAPLTQLLRAAMLPADFVWARVRRVEDVYLSGADRRVGVHVRYRGGYEEFLRFHDAVNQNVKACVADHGLLPKTTSNATATAGRWSVDFSTLASKASAAAAAAPPRKLTVVFISSLYGSLYEEMKAVYPQRIPNSTTSAPREVVSLVQLTAEGTQGSDVETDERALVEILCLSFSDVLLTSPLSTFSELAQGYGGLRPWVVSLRRRDGRSPSACRRGRSADACYQGAAFAYVCPHDPELKGQLVTARAPFLRPCEDGSEGLQFVP